MNGTPIIDIKPYLSFTDSHPDAVCGFADEVFDKQLKIVYEADISEFDKSVIKEISNILKQDPRPSYQNDPDRIYSMAYDKYDILFRVEKETLKVTEIKHLPNGSEK